MTRFIALSMAMGIALASLVRTARAEGKPVTCTTQSGRPPGEIVVPVTDDPDGPTGITIDEGETLCLTGSVDGSPTFRPRLVDPDRGEPTLVLVRRERNGPSTTLRVRTSLRRSLEYQAAVLLGPTNLAFPIVDSTTVSSGVDDQTRPEASAHRWLLYGFYLDTGRPAVTPPLIEWSVAEHRTFEFALTALAGVRRLALGGFDAPLRASGYAPLPAMFPSAGGDLQVVFGQWRFQLGGQYAWGTARALDGAGGIGASLTDVHIDGGYDFLRWRGLTGFVLGGFGVDSFTIDAHGTGWIYLADRAAAVGNPDRLARSGGFFTLQTGFEETVPLGHTGQANPALFLSLQGGYSRQLGISGWQGNGPSTTEVGGPPDVDPSGTWLSLGIGLGLFTNAPGGILSL